MEASLVSRAGIPFEAIPAAGLHGVGLTSLPGNAVRLLQGWRQARALLRRFQPDVLFFTGGYVGVPVALAGRNIPSVMYVPDIEPALALTWIGRTVDIVAVTATETKAYFPQGKRVDMTGYPVRQELEQVDRASSKRHFQLEDGLPTLLVFGGSRGARSINEAVWSSLETLLDRMQIVHITGRLDWPRVEDVQTALPQQVVRRYHAYPYLHEEMAMAFAAADLALSRAGAATMGEYPHFGLPSVLVPYPHAWRYQKVNADFLASRGAAVVLEDSAMATELVKVVSGIMNDEGRRTRMGAAAAALKTGQAAARIAALIQEAGQEGGNRG